MEIPQIFVDILKRKGVEYSPRVGSESVLLPGLRAGVEKMKKIMGIFLALLIAAGIGVLPGSAAAGSGVLILKNSDAWNSPTVENTLSSMGISYDVMTSLEFKTLSPSTLQTYRLVIIVSDQNQTFYDEIGATINKLSTYVMNGGSLEIHAANWGWNGGVWTTAMPGGTRIIQSYSSVDVITVTNQMLVSSYASHGYLVGFPAGAEITTIQNNTGKPSTVSYTLGKGRVFVTGLTFEYSVARDKPGWKAFFEEVISQNLNPPQKEIETQEGPATMGPNFMALNMMYYLRYTRSLNEYGTLHKAAIDAQVDPATINASVMINQTASEHYSDASRYGEVKANLMRISIFSDLRKAALAQQEAVDILKDALNEG
ncbi:pyrolysin [Thermococcus sp.]